MNFTGIAQKDFGNTFKEAFPGGFPWEVLKVISGPPILIFTWRHWGNFHGKFQNNVGHGAKLEIIGICRAEVNSDMKIQKIEMFHDLQSFIKVLDGTLPASELGSGKAILGDISQPFIDRNINRN